MGYLYVLKFQVIFNPHPTRACGTAMSLVSDKVTNTTPLPRFLSLSRYGRRPFKYFIYTLATFLALWIVLFRNNQVLVTPPQAKEESLWQWTAVEEIFAL